MIWLQPLAAFLTAYYLVNVALWHVPLKRALHRPGRLKPFDCAQCLSVWFAVMLYFLPVEVSQFLCLTFGAGFIATKIK
jgi:hypothetical protein